MAVFHISYDIKTRHDFEYKALWEALKKLGAVRCLLSEWLAASNASQADVYKYLKPLVHKDDRLMVIRVYDRPSWNVGLKGTQAFIDAHWPT